MVVHFFMYFYYFNPKTFSSFRMAMTTLQIVQFLHVLAYSVWHVKIAIENNFVPLCDEDFFVICFTNFWYIVYLILFLNFFIQQYFAEPREKGKRE